MAEAAAPSLPPGYRRIPGLDVELVGGGGGGGPCAALGTRRPDTLETGVGWSGGEGPAAPIRGGAALERTGRRDSANARVPCSSGR